MKGLVTYHQIKYSVMNDQLLKGHRVHLLLITCIYNEQNLAEPALGFFMFVHILVMKLS